ncbi:hypothetical protein HOG98_00380 [bacterium]|jgi:hypothetical protein|nr:hypothetical protein [bacterium]
MKSTLHKFMSNSFKEEIVFENLSSTLSDLMQSVLELKESSGQLFFGRLTITSQFTLSDFKEQMNTIETRSESYVSDFSGSIPLSEDQKLKIVDDVLVEFDNCDDLLLVYFATEVINRVEKRLFGQEKGISR